MAILLAWLADVNARRTAWRSIARARQTLSTERVARNALRYEPCPFCRPGLEGADGRPPVDEHGIAQRD